MIPIIVMLCIIALIGLVVYGSSIVTDPIVYIADCEDCDKNVLCMYCWGMIEKRCSCQYKQPRQCQCIEPQRSDVHIRPIGPS